MLKDQALLSQNEKKYVEKTVCIFFSDRMQNINNKQREFFSNCKRMGPADREREYQKIKLEFKKVRQPCFLF